MVQGSEIKLIFPDQSENAQMSGERYVPGHAGNIQHEHYHRYLFAAEYCKGKRVLDVACGEGYGCYLLAQVASEVVGVDIDADIVAHADRNYRSPTTTFVVGDATKLPFDDDSFDVVTSFETIEHFADHEAFILEVARVLRPSGVFVSSSPNRAVYTEQNGHDNPFHVRELNREEFVAALRGGFQNVKLLEQRPICGSTLIVEQGPVAISSYESLDGRTYARSEGVPSVLYYVALASDSVLPPAHSTLLFNDAHIPQTEEIERSLRQELTKSRAIADESVQLLAVSNKRIRVLESSITKVAPSPMLTRIAAAWRYPTSSSRRKMYRATKLGAGATLTTGSKSRNSGSVFGKVFGRSACIPTDAELFQNFVRNTVYPSATGEFVERSVEAPLSGNGVKLIAYYLPQFHPIPENDEWWGKGFTEWRNVARAFPVFADHYQPRVPGEFGYYDLRVSDTMRRQVDLARQYGLSAFCFHFYWFGGKRLLELPIETFLENKDFDLEFSLCWANENWSRRWDGGDNEVLISQDHSPEDDLAFIRYIKKYFDDPRYTRIDGKPVLTIYRPGVFPDIKKTTDRWRSEALRMGYPGLYLIATNSFDFEGYEAFGFDALSEFPPHQLNAAEMQDALHLASTRTGGRIYNYESLVESECNKAKSGKVVHPGVMPSWDNSARRPHDSHIFHGATPELFGRWLRNAVDRAAHHSTSERLVFINAWNEWAEGAYLEPDARYGYAWLRQIQVASRVAGAKVAIVVHAYYPDVFEGILTRLEALPKSFKLFVTTVPEKATIIRNQLSRCGRDFELSVFDNKGRDVSPFMKIFPKIRSEGFEFLVKVHTKKSLHRKDGAKWQSDMLSKLLSVDTIDRGLAAFSTNPTLGMVGPEGHCLSMSGYFGSNRERVLSIGGRLGLTEAEICDTPFFAGTMFLARLDALTPLMDLNLADEDFETEDGQIDGTLAHALERAMALSVRAAEMYLASSEHPESPVKAGGRYQFAARTRGE